MRERTTMVCTYCGFRHPWDRQNFPDRMVAMCVDCFGGADSDASTEADIRPETSAARNHRDRRD